MFIKSKFTIEIDLARGINESLYLQGLSEACIEKALLYKTVARWVKAFNAGHPIS